MGLRRHLSIREKPRFREAVEADFVFCYVRDPITRAESLHRWFAQLHETDTKRRPENAAINAFARLVDVNTFWMKIDIDYLNRQMTGNMFRSQSWFVTTNAGDVHSRMNVLRFEDFAEEWKKVEDAAGIQIELPHVNSTKKDGRERLSGVALEHVCKLYEIDFLNFYPNHYASQAKN